VSRIGIRLSFPGLGWASVCAFALWLEPSLGQIARYLGLWGGIACAGVAGMGIFLALAWLRRKTLGAEPPWGPLMAIGLAGAALFLILFPIATSGLLGRGSDRLDGLNVMLRAVLQGRPPYDQFTFMGNPPTQLPGSLLMALPFFILGATAYQNLAWLAIFIWLSPAMIGGRRAAGVYLLIFLLACPGALQDFVTGGDYLINAIYVAVSVHLVLEVKPAGPQVHRLLAYLFFAVCLSSRPIYVVEVPIVAAFTWQTRGAAGFLEFVVTVGATLLAINLPVFLTDPARFPIFARLNKLNFYPAAMYPAIVIPAISLGIACCAGLVRMSPRRVFLISALSFIPLFTPGLVFRLFTQGPVADVLLSAGYSLPLTIFGGLWLFNTLTGSGLAPCQIRRAELAVPG
jgi:hypothetical protein